MTTFQTGRGGRWIARGLALIYVLTPLCFAGCEPNDYAEEGDLLSLDTTSVAEESPAEIWPLERPTVEPGRQYSTSLITDRGTVAIDLFSEEAPYTTSNFIHLAAAGFYDGLTFHKVIPGFVAQAGDPTGTGRGGPGYTFPDETNRRKHLRGTVSMANTGSADTNGSQFFVCLAELPFLDGRHTVFGKVMHGMGVVDSLVTGDMIRKVEILTE